MKKIVIIPSLLGAMAIGGVLAFSSDIIGSAEDSIISMAEAEQKALGVVNGKVVDIEKEKQGTKIYYDVEIETKDAEYDLKIDAITGDIVKKTKGPLMQNTIQKNELTNNPNNSKEAQNINNVNTPAVSVNNQSNTNVPKENSNNNTNNNQKEVRQVKEAVTSPAPTNSANPSGIISRDEAKQIALSAVDGKVYDIEFELEYVGSKVYYEIDIDTTEAEYDVIIDGQTGSIVRKSKEFHDHDWDDDFFFNN